MQSFESRLDRRQIRFELRAQKGLYTSEEILYKSEAKKLSGISNGFSVTKIADSETKRGLGVYLVSWEKPYGDILPKEVEDFLKGDSDVPVPDDLVKTNAQSLYLSARRFNNNL